MRKYPAMNQQDISQLTKQQSQKKTRDDVVRDELDLSSSSDQELFLTSVENLYSTVMSYEAIARREQYHQLSFADVRGEEIFEAAGGLWQDIQGRMSRYRKQTEQTTSSLSDQEIELLQKKYDDLLLLRNLLEEVYGTDVTISKKNRLNRAVDNDRSKESENLTESKPVVQRNKDEKVDNEKINEIKRIFKELEQILYTAEKHVTVVRARVLNRIPSVERVADTGTRINELNDCANRLVNLRKRIEFAKTERIELSVLQQTFKKYSRMIGKLINRVDHLEELLVQRKIDATLTAQSMPAKIVSKVIPDMPRMNVRDDNQVPTTSSELPSDAEVTALAKTVFEDQFYTSAERKKTQILCESLYRSVAAGGSSTECNKQYDALREYIAVLQKSPNVADLRERATRIIQRVTAGMTYDSGILRTVRRLEHDFRSVADDPKKSEERTRAAYRDLEQFVRKHETEWLMICGLNVPKSGIEGVSTARTLRETLLIERDRHRMLVQDPKKQVLVDKLIRKLSVIPPTGLSLETDIPEIIRLIRAIDVPDQQGELNIVTRGVDTLAEAQPVKTENEEEESAHVLSQTIHKVMDVSTEDVEESVEIRVAEKTKQRIFEQTHTPTQVPAVDLENEERVVDNTLVATLEKQDPVNAVRSIFTPKLQRAAPILSEHSLTRRYLSAAKYQDFIARHYTSPAAFERILDLTITQIEAQTIDALERWLGEERATAFTFLEEMSVGNILRFSESNEIRTIVTAENIKYETFLVWLDLLPEMLSVVGEDLDQPFGCLYAKWMIETEMERERAVMTR